MMNEIIRQKLKTITTDPGCYIMRDDTGAVIYVGKAKNLKNRVSQYFNNGEKLIKVQTMVDHIADFDYFVTLSEQDAFALENNLIKKYQPFYNILLKDSKTFAYIKVDLKKPFPRFEITRKLKNDGAKYFGPYITGVSATDVLSIISESFNVVLCKEKLGEKTKKRACLYYFMGNCPAPCIGNITKEEYRKNVDKVIEFLKGNDDLAEERLKERMMKYAEQENFEKALEMKNKIKIVEKLKQKVVANLPKDLSLDAFSIVSDGEVGAVCVLTLRCGKILGAANYAISDGGADEADSLSEFIMQYYQKVDLPKEILTNISLNKNTDESENLQKTEQNMQKTTSDSLENYFFDKTNKKVNIICPKIALKKNITQMAENNAKEYLSKNVRQEKMKFAKTLGALINLKNELDLGVLPKRMECYDISNIQGTNKVASMVVFINGEPARKMYRKFKIKTVEGPNDFESLKETLTRRFEELKKTEDESFSQKPDLMVIDGGKGQLSSCWEILQNAKIGGIKMISLAKKFEEVYLPNQSYPVMLRRSSEELKLLQRLRDETHRFAITFHRHLRDKNEFSDPLDNIKGVGKVKRLNLYRQFKTLENIKNASVDELALVRGIDRNLAEKIYEYLNKQQ